MKNYKERPFVRRRLIKFLADNPHISLEDISRGYWVEKTGRKHNFYHTGGERTQSRKMLAEQPVTPIKPEESTAEVPVEIDPSELRFIFEQTSKNVSTGTLVAKLGDKIIMVDSFNLAKESLRNRFIVTIQRTGLLPCELYPKKDLAQCLLDMSIEAVLHEENYVAGLSSFMRGCYRKSSHLPNCIVEDVFKKGDS